MGVKGMWKLLLPIGRRISLETLRGQVLAIDASIWLTQFLKAMRDPETGQVTAAAHLIGYMRRICRLLFHQIRPVFVFDGRAPEIKQRELQLRRQRRNEFVSKEESIQRYARKLIHETLLRQQQKQIQALSRSPSDTNETGAFVRGFHLGGEDNVKPSLNDTTETEDVIDLSTATDLVAPDDPKSIIPASDWDIPLAVAASEEAKELDALEAADQGETAHGNDDSDSDAIEYEDFIPPSDITQQNPWGRGKKGAAHNVKSVAQIAVLPLTERKDAIEAVQRQRRLQSRKEFLPAAHDPVQFSSVQLSNFLKSCQLNKDIVSMAKHSVQQEDQAKSGGGELMASDRTTRVELIRENEASSAPPKSTSFAKSLMWQAESTRPEEEDDSESDLGTEKTSKNDSSDAMDQWEDSVAQGDGDATIQKALWEDAVLESKASPKKRRHIVINDDEEEGGFGDVKVLEDCDAAIQMNVESNIVDISLSNVQNDGLSRRKGDEDDIDWEDGENANDVVELPHDNVDKSTSQCRNSLIVTSSPERSERDNGLNGGDDVDWEDGDDHMENDEGGDDGVFVSEVHTHPLVSKKPATQSSDPYSGNPTSSHIEGKTPVFSKGTSDALIQAQTTAAQLTNWAGRAFRRAIVEANGGLALDGSGHSSSSDSEVDVNAGELHSENPSLHQPLATSRNDMEIFHGNHIDGSPMFSSCEPQASMKNMRTGNSVTAPSSITYDAALLERYDAEWTAERNRRERDMETISDDMLLEVKHLLQLFGIPYIEAPSEAEAQCACLESLGLVDGIVTEDSDVFVFGGKTVYKNIFEEQKYAEVYNASDAEREMKIDRNSMVALAMLLGGDYTEGVKGVGIVNAMEVLDTFDVSQSVQDGLKHFRTWLDGFNPPEVQKDDDDEDLEAQVQKVKESAFHMKHMSARTRWTVPQNFPAENVIKAYVEPVVDKSTEPFSWGAPDFENIITFCSKHIGWAPEDTKRLLEPVVQVRNGKKGMVQTRIDSFMRYEDGIKFADVRSKRLRDVLGLSSDTSTGRANKKKRSTKNTSA